MTPETARADAATVRAPAATASPGPGTSVLAVETGGGPLLVLGDRKTVALHEVGAGRYVGRVTRVRVVDARGTDAGWALSVAMASPAGGITRVHVERIEAFAESTSGISAVDARLARGRPAEVVRADAGHSGGAYDVTLVVEWDAIDAKSSPPTIDGLLSLRAG